MKTREEKLKAIISRIKSPIKDKKPQSIETTKVSGELLKPITQNEIDDFLATEESIKAFTEALNKIGKAGFKI